jgi:hypothetical protein
MMRIGATDIFGATLKIGPSGTLIEIGILAHPDFHV